MVEPPCDVEGKYEGGRSSIFEPGGVWLAGGTTTSRIRSQRTADWVTRQRPDQRRSVRG